MNHRLTGVSAGVDDLPSGSISRRRLAVGAAWAAPVIVMAAPAPVFAASPKVCSPGTLDWDLAPTSGGKVVNGTMVPITLANGTRVYARVTLSGAIEHVGSTATYDMTTGNRAWGSVALDYTMTTTSGSKSLVMNQKTTSTRTVKLDFFKDAGATQPLTVQNVRVPLDDFSTARAWNWLGGLETNRSYQEAWSVTGTLATGGTVTPTKTALTSPYANPNSTLANVRGSGTTADPWYFPASLTSNKTNLQQVGGNLQTSFGTAALKSITVTYGTNEPSFSGAQGSALGDISVCA